MTLVAILSVRVHGLIYRKYVASPISTSSMSYSHVATAPPPQCTAFTSSRIVASLGFLVVHARMSGPASNAQGPGAQHGVL